jgi:hypothetical protein
MLYKNKNLLELVPTIELGSSIAEQDTLLETARVETSVFSDLLADRIDLIPGTKGSGKSALYRIFVEFLPDFLLQHRKVVIAHGVNRHGDSVFHVFKDRFKKLGEEDFVDFWCVYLISLIHEQFIKNPRYSKHLEQCNSEIEVFRRSCHQALIPDIRAQKSLKDILEWTLFALASIRPRLKYNLPDNAGQLEMDFLIESKKSKKISSEDADFNLPSYAAQIKKDLEVILTKINLNIWLMIDRLDEIFPRRSDLERRSLRGLLRTIRIFSSDQIRIKVFLRDDILNAVVAGGEGFTALTHLTARQADTLRWSEDQILTMIVNRLSTNTGLCRFLAIDNDKIKASLAYRREVFYKVFPGSVHKGTRQSGTLAWIYNHTADGNNVVTPRDVIDLLSIAKQHQHDIFISNPSGQSSWIIGPQAIQYGLTELSKRKRTAFLEAEFPQFWPYIEKFIGRKTEYTEKALNRLLGKGCQDIVKDLISIGLIFKGKSKGEFIYKIPFLYRKGLDLTQGRAY